MKKSLNLVAFLAIGIPCWAGSLGDGKAAMERHEYVRAAEAFGASCARGEAEGCLRLGELYEKGEGVAQNPYEASSLYAAACRAGEAKGCGRMGLNVTP